MTIYVDWKRTIMNIILISILYANNIQRHIVKQIFKTSANSFCKLIISIQRYNILSENFQIQEKQLKNLIQMLNLIVTFIA